ncbi:hypothetical protein PPYR_14732 [Photinus pyralis]|uniref:HTH CENPB-type domain-containing protein n=1 Tax=Photinus pyralis TaxID=7054 RepID=A0A5N4A627_PHOPY|nr:tigger transposable element-derived protein 2-like [Photinus pyralis]KAB0792773.1 hypothetical protein PPYR_14732 [Photinus pyralis]
MTTKRKKVIVSLDKKLDAINRIDKGESMRSIAQEMGVGSSTVSDWKRNRKEIEEFCKKMVTAVGLQGRGTMKSAKNKQLDDALFAWFAEENARGTVITGPILQKKALSLNQELPMNDPGFTASHGWLEKWKTRHGIGHSFACERKVQGEASVKQEMGVCKNFKLEDVYFSEESETFVTDSHGDDTSVENVVDSYSWNVEKVFINEQSHSGSALVANTSENISEVVTHMEATVLFDKLLIYLQSQGDTTAREMSVVNELRSRAARKRGLKTWVQQKITQYFSNKEAV